MADVSANPCPTCGACCRSYGVPALGYDIWRLYTEQRLDPVHYLRVFAAPDPGRDGFLLAPGGPLQTLLLDKRGPFKWQAPCIFLTDLAADHAVCGVYASRPSVCRAYPMAIAQGVIFQRSDALCPPDAWPLPAVRRPGWRTGLQDLYRHLDIYHEVVARWNARVTAAPPGVAFPVQAYYSFVLNVYDRLAVLDAGLSDETRATIARTWPTNPRPALRPADIAVYRARWPWLDYLLQARAIIDAFYPTIPPQPLIVARSSDPAPAGV